MMKVDLTVKTTCDFPKCNFDHLSKRPDIAQALAMQGSYKEATTNRM